MAIGIALAGSVWVARSPTLERERWPLIATFALLAFLAALPLAVAISDALYIALLPAALPVMLALPPVFYRFVLSHSHAEKRPGRHWPDAVLPGLSALVALGFWSLPHEARHTMLAQGDLPPGALAAALALLTFGLVFFWIGSSAVYLTSILRRLHAFRRELKDLYSNTHSRELRWVEWFMVLLALVWTAAALALIGENSPISAALPGEIVLALIALLMLFLIAFVPSGQAPEETGAAEEVSEPAGPEAAKYSRSALSRDHAKRLAARIEAAMANDRLYLDPNLSLPKLSKHVGALPNQISQVLNDEIGVTFFDYVARWRVEAAKPMIAAREASIVMIALDVGFNSRSTFYKAFKRATGMTPKAFREAAGDHDS
ncbi:helix-turn-helix transcriptional regulator [Qipengyuania flava]|uniref:helix-turn-helix transcriptional regulator n=1 Tax=Qipengyuania flava TaxID=192812 RepID=UPI001C63A1FE|nr:helix-turn-helix transcriptional regulator [Qipengyuania flava]QYJ07728.1 helix-turn-helix transcriptional regulator [Qipengyuania flava]